MSRKRVYELAKELGIDSKELIARMEKLGMIVRSHSSTLEDSEVERIKREFAKGGPGEVVEERIKSTVIRRRFVKAAVEEVREQPVSFTGEEKREEKMEVVAAPKKESIQQVRVAVKEEQEEVLEALKHVEPQKQVEPSLRKVTPPESTKHEESAVPEVPVHIVNEESFVSLSPEEQLTEVSAKDFVIGEEESEQISAAVIQETEIEEKPVKLKEAEEVEEITSPVKEDRVAGLKLVKEGSSVAEKKLPKVELEKEKKKGKKPIEIIISEPPPKKKLLVKKVFDRRERFEDLVDYEERPIKWKEAKKEITKVQKPLITVPKPIKRRFKMGETITVGDLAKKMGVKASEVIGKLMNLGLMITINQVVDFDTASLIASEFGYQVESAESELEETLLQRDTEPRNLKPRAPVVTIMGHVDHGKTSLLDAIRQTNVIEGEAGGITQAIGAYHVKVKDREIVFLDTPGHEAFTAMRARGAQVTDIVVLVVAADDGVMEQTVEAINHAKAAGVPIIVAINKIDKPNANPEKIKQALTEYNLVPEEWGGDTIYCEVSAKYRVNIEELLELILLQADIMELKADPDRSARGVVIESKLDKGRGPVATVLIQEGTLREGDNFVCKTEYGRVRAMINDQGRRVKEAGPSMPVEVIGFSRVPPVGAEFLCVEDDKKAKQIAEYWMRKEREKELYATSKITLEQLYQKIKEGVKDFNVIVKGDVQGSVEAITEALNRLSTSDVKIKIIHSSTGTVTETDVMLASAANAIIIGFNVRPDSRVMELAEQEGVEIKLYDVIYNLISDVKAAMEGLLEPIYQDVVLGRAEVRQLFRISKVGTVAGCYVSEGKIVRSANVRLIRDGVVIYDGRIGSLKRLKDDVREVLAGFECGVSIENFQDLKVGDIIEVYTKERVERKL
ncbi:MAG: translation initiation factor IF-2 [Syntrophales bacterium]|nr:translation initiation factor IF-2 [Syntrophales bacterium]